MVCPQNGAAFLKELSDHFRCACVPPPLLPLLLWEKNRLIKKTSYDRDVLSITYGIPSITYYGIIVLMNFFRLTRAIYGRGSTFLPYEAIFLTAGRSSSTLLVPQSRSWDKPRKFKVVSPQTGTAVLRRVTTEGSPKHCWNIISFFGMILDKYRNHGPLHKTTTNKD